MDNRNNGPKLVGEGSHDGRMHSCSVRFLGEDYYGVNGQIVPNAMESIMANLESLKKMVPEYQAVRFKGETLVYRLGDNPEQFRALNNPHDIFGLAQVVEDDARKSGFNSYEAEILAGDIIKLCGLKETSYWAYLEQHEKTLKSLQKLTPFSRKNFVPKLVG